MRQNQASINLVNKERNKLSNALRETRVRNGVNRELDLFTRLPELRLLDIGLRMLCRPSTRQH
jgi:hypothetical protein